MPYDTIPIALINDLVFHESPIILILDDYQAIQDSAIHQGVEFLIENQPEQLKIIIASRMDPPWPLARLRARNHLLEIREADLRFSLQEVEYFLARTMGLQLTPEEIASLGPRTEGWIAGLQLAGLAMRADPIVPGKVDTGAFIETFAGNHLFIADYLLEEVLNRQPEGVQAFLLETSILDRFEASLCAAVTGRHDAGKMLSTIYQGNAFVIALDNKGQWFRYHQLFADMLQARLGQFGSEQAVRQLHKRASKWYEAHGFTFEAIKFALAGNDFEQAAKLVVSVARSMVFTGRLDILRGWLEALPDTIYQEHVQLTFYLFWVDLLQNRADLSDETIHGMEARLEALPRSPENNRLKGKLMAVVCRAVALSGRISEGIRLAQKALEHLASDDLASLARANSAFAIAHDLEGRATIADPAYDAAIAQAISAGDYLLAAHTMMVRGLVLVHYGQLHEAAAVFQRIIQLGEVDRHTTPEGQRILDGDERQPATVFYPAGQGYIGLGSVYLEWNELEAAEQQLKQGVELCRRGGMDGLFIGRMQLSRLRQAQGDLEGALDQLQLTGQAERIDGFNVATRQIQILLASGDIEGAWAWAQPIDGMLNEQHGHSETPLLFFEIVLSIMARVYIARGENEHALALLDRLVATAGPAQRNDRLVEAYLLRALALLGDGEPSPAAIENFLMALQLGESPGFSRLFLDEGKAVIKILTAVVRRPGTSDRLKKYGRYLLDSLSTPTRPSTGPSHPGVDSLLEPLTPREMEVLQLLAAGFSNKEIAQKLVITVRTVKKHTGNIYGKLNVSSRTQAVASAHQIDLLPGNH